LLHSVNLMRELLEAPTKLSAADLLACRAIAQRTADACNFNAGWYMANPDKELKGSAATEKLLADLRTITEYLQMHAKPRRGKGRPRVDALDPEYVPVLIAITLAGLEESPAGIRHVVTQALREGVLKDRTRIADGVRATTTTEAHLKKVDRELKKLAKRREEKAWAKTNNVLIFRPRKPARRKIDRN
jgi:hypothetical protein